MTLKAIVRATPTNRSMRATDETNMLVKKIGLTAAVPDLRELNRPETLGPKSPASFMPWDDSPEPGIAYRIVSVIIRDSHYSAGVAIWKRTALSKDRGVYSKHPNRHH